MKASVSDKKCGRFSCVWVTLAFCSCLSTFCGLCRADRQLHRRRDVRPAGDGEVVVVEGPQDRTGLEGQPLGGEGRRLLRRHLGGFGNLALRSRLRGFLFLPGRGKRFHPIPSGRLGSVFHHLGQIDYRLVLFSIIHRFPLK